MTTTPETSVRRPVPELEAAKAYKRLMAARRAADEATAKAAQAYTEAETARAQLTEIEAEYRAIKRECVL
jgi:hypothetical protein